MEKKFKSLSEELRNECGECGCISLGFCFIRQDKLKEFIRLLKEGETLGMQDKIDKLSGEHLSGDE